MEAPKKNTVAITPAIDYRRQDNFVSTYANNAYLETSLWDFGMIFGKLDQALGNNVVLQEGSVNLPWPQVKLLAYLMAVNVVSYEAINGRIVLGKGVVPPVPQEMPAEFKNLPSAELAHDAIRKEYERFIKDNPEAGDL